MLDQVIYSAEGGCSTWVMEQLELFDTSPFTNQSMVYVGARNGFIKIGVSRHPQVRAHQLQMHLLRVMPGTRDDEQALHRRFAQDRIDREWFMPSPRLLQWITAA